MCFPSARRRGEPPPATTATAGLWGARGPGDTAVAIPRVQTQACVQCADAARARGGVLYAQSRDPLLYEKTKLRGCHRGGSSEQSQGLQLGR
jgi:hypothetical protein